MRRIIIAALVVVAALCALGLSSSLGNVRAYQESCGTTATAISDGYSSSSMLIWNNSTTPVYLGAANVTASTTNGFPICTDTANCLRADMPIDGKYLYCRVAAGSVSVTILTGAM